MKLLYENISKYYSNKIARFGPTPQGVDWKDESSQVLRLEQLVHIIRGLEKFTINDLGSGYGRLLLYLEERGFRNFNYRGYDVSEAMIQAALLRYKQIVLSKGTAWSFSPVKSAAEMEPAEYTVASGIFNVKMSHNDDEWTEYVVETLNEMNRLSTLGFSFNVLTKYSDKEHMRPDLYYADPCYLFDYCKTRFSRDVALLHDYGLYEFTLLIRKG